MIDGRSLDWVWVGRPVCWVAPAALDAVVSAAVFGGVKLRPTTFGAWTLKPLSTVGAAKVTVVPRAPAEPRSMVPCGATKVTLLLLGSCPGRVRGAAMPAPVTRP